MKILKWLGILMAILFAGVALLYLVLNEPVPKAVGGAEADELAKKMMLAVDKPAWDSTRYLHWTFKGIHSFLWDKDRNWARVTAGENQVFLRLDDVDGKAFQNKQPLSGDAANQAIQDAWGYWCNDSFWFNAVVKAFDPGTSRSIVKQEDGSDALLVTYNSGGVTPGDKYLWILDENYRPKAWKMWVKIIPTGGMEFSWENWTKLSTGAYISTLHKSNLLDLDISEIKGGMAWQDVGETTDPFEGILTEGKIQ